MSPKQARRQAILTLLGLSKGAASNEVVAEDLAVALADADSTLVLILAELRRMNDIAEETMRFTVPLAFIDPR